VQHNLDEILNYPDEVLNDATPAGRCLFVFSDYDCRDLAMQAYTAEFAKKNLTPFLRGRF
jgi:hypothetical protein